MLPGSTVALASAACAVLFLGGEPVDILDEVVVARISDQSLQAGYPQHRMGGSAQRTVLGAEAIIPHEMRGFMQHHGERGTFQVGRHEVDDAL